MVALILAMIGTLLLLAPACFHANQWRKRRLAVDKLPESPLEIIFDPANSKKRFWSQTPVLDKDGNPIAKLCMEYRVRIYNKSEKTVRGVHVERVGEGEIPSMPADLSFKKDGAGKRDLQPKHSEFVPFFWVHAPQEGDAWGADGKALF
jgi:hypothetical protein